MRTAQSLETGRASVKSVHRVSGIDALCIIALTVFVAVTAWWEEISGFTLRFAGEAWRIIEPYWPVLPLLGLVVVIVAAFGILNHRHWHHHEKKKWSSWSP